MAFCFLYIALLAAADPGGTAAPVTDPGNDPLFTLLATLVFVVVSLGGGLLAFKAQNRKRPKS